MENQKISRGDLITEKIRKVLINIDFKIAYAVAQLKIANENYKFFVKLEGNKNKQQALENKILIVCYKIYLKNLKDIKKQMMVDIKKILSRYYKKQKIIWIKYFINNESIEDISLSVDQSTQKIEKLIDKFKNDINYIYEKEKTTKWN